MSLENILLDWSDYEDRKKKETKDTGLFSCDEAWEIYYLKNRIQKEFTTLNEIKILEAIEQCCRFATAPKPRKDFVQCVLARLKLMEALV
jgi:hypothetical protein